MSRHVAVLMGGWSSERPVSLRSGAACAEALRGAGYSVTEIDVGRDIHAVLAKLKPDMAFNALLGGGGSNGVIQSALELLALPYTHSGVLASALASNRHQAKITFRGANIPVTDHLLADRADVARAHVMAPPYVIKPIAEGHSFDAILVRGDSHDPPQELIGPDWRGGEDVLVERYIPGVTLSCAVMGDVALGVTAFVPPSEQERVKSGSDAPIRVFPADIQPKIYDKVQKMSLRAHAALGCRGVTRSDFRFNARAGEDGELVYLDLNTQPDLSQSAVLPEQASKVGHSYGELVTWIVEDASCNR